MYEFRKSSIENETKEVKTESWKILKLTVVKNSQSGKAVMLRLDKENTVWIPKGFVKSINNSNACTVACPKDFVVKIYHHPSKNIDELTWLELWQAMGGKE